MAKEILISAPEGNIHPKTGKKILSVTKQQLLQIFQECWSADISSDPDGRNMDVPSWFQCASTSLVVRKLCYSIIASQNIAVKNEKAKLWKQKYFPGDLDQDIVTHYLNFMRTTSGKNVNVDFAEGQFNVLGVYNTKIIKPIQGDIEQEKIDWILSNCEIVGLKLEEKMNTLLQRVKGKLALALQESLQEMDMSLDEYLVNHKLLLDESLPL